MGGIRVSECEKCGDEVQTRNGTPRKYCYDCLPAFLKNRDDIRDMRQDSQKYSRTTEKTQTHREVVSNCQRCDVEVVTTKSNTGRKYCNDCLPYIRAKNQKKSVDSDYEKPEVTCNYCGKTEKSSNPDKKYCTKMCKQMAQTGIPYETYTLLKEGDGL